MSRILFICLCNKNERVNFFLWRLYNFISIFIFIVTMNNALDFGTAIYFLGQWNEKQCKLFPENFNSN